MHDAVKDFHLDRLPIAPIRGNALPSSKHLQLQRVATVVEGDQDLQHNHDQARECRKTCEVFHCFILKERCYG